MHPIQLQRRSLLLSVRTGTQPLRSVPRLKEQNHLSARRCLRLYGRLLRQRQQHVCCLSVRLQHLFLRHQLHDLRSFGGALYQRSVPLPQQNLLRCLPRRRALLRCLRPLLSELHRHKHLRNLCFLLHQNSRQQMHLFPPKLHRHNRQLPALRQRLPELHLSHSLQQLREPPRPPRLHLPTQLQQRLHRPRIHLHLLPHRLPPVHPKPTLLLLRRQLLRLQRQLLLCLPRWNCWRQDRRKLELYPMQHSMQNMHQSPILLHQLPQWLRVPADLSRATVMRSEVR